MIKTFSTARPSKTPSLVEWLAEFKVGVQAPKFTNERPARMMEGWNFEGAVNRLQVQSDSTPNTSMASN
jgi:hypothetical protein